jgi:hypothetical protein
LLDDSTAVLGFQFKASGNFHGHPYQERPVPHGSPTRAHGTNPDSPAARFGQRFCLYSAGRGATGSLTLFSLTSGGELADGRLYAEYLPPGAKFGGAAPSVRAANTTEVSKQRIERLQNDVLGSGSASSKRSHGVTSHGGRLKKHLSGSSVTILRR